MYNYQKKVEATSKKGRTEDEEGMEKNTSKNDVEQTTLAFLEQQGRRKSQRKIKGGCQ